jgi:hypothetical protein
MLKRKKYKMHHGRRDRERENKHRDMHKHGEILGSERFQRWTFEWLKGKELHMGERNKRDRDRWRETQNTS